MSTSSKCDSPSSSEKRRRSFIRRESTSLIRPPEIGPPRMRVWKLRKERKEDRRGEETEAHAGPDRAQASGGRSAARGGQGRARGFQASGDLRADLSPVEKPVRR